MTEKRFDQLLDTFVELGRRLVDNPSDAYIDRAVRVLRRILDRIFNKDGTARF
jgi:hypothetical protein